MILLTLLLISLGCNVSYQVLGQYTDRTNPYKFNNYVCDIYNSEYVDYYSPGSRKGARSPPKLGYDVRDNDDEDDEDVTEDDLEDFDIFLMVPDDDDSSSTEDEGEILTSETKDGKLNDTLSHNTINNEQLAKESILNERVSNKAKRDDGIEERAGDNEVTPSEETCSFSFDDFEAYEIDQSRLEKLRNQVMIILDQRRNRQKNQAEDDKANEVEETEVEETEVEDPSRNQQTSNVFKDMIHNGLVRRGYPGQEYDENMEHCPRQPDASPSQMDRLRNALGGRFRPRHSLVVETSPSSAKFTLTGRRAKLENPTVYVIDNKDRVKELDEFCIADKHALLEDSLKSSNLYLCYPAKVKIRENRNDQVEVILMKTVVRSMLDRCTESFFNSNLGRIFAKRFYNLILL